MDGLLFQVFFNGLCVFLAVYPVNLQPFGSELGLELLERRTFFPAVRSPGGPEIHQNDLSGRIPKIDFISVEVFDREIRGRNGLRIGMEYAG